MPFDEPIGSAVYLWILPPILPALIKHLLGLEEKQYTTRSLTSKLSKSAAKVVSEVFLLTKLDSFLTSSE